MKTKIALSMLLALAACAPQVKTTWIRTDGAKPTPAMAQQFEVDKIICTGDTTKADMAGTQFCRGALDCAVASSVRSKQVEAVAQGCMAQKGYLLVNEDVAEAKQAELAALAKQSAPQPARQQAASRQ